MTYKTAVQTIKKEIEGARGVSVSTAEVERYINRVYEDANVDGKEHYQSDVARAVEYGELTVNQKRSGGWAIWLYWDLTHEAAIDLDTMESLTKGEIASELE